MENSVIVFDDACPLCEAYTGAFSRMGWVKRCGFSEAPPELLSPINLDRARHEIPLVDTQTGEVRYGLDALFFILGARMPGLRPLFRQRFFRAALGGLYRVITYNRRIISGSRPPARGFDCAPDRNVFYRCLYIAFAAATAGWIALEHWPGNAWLSLLTGANAALLAIGMVLLPDRLSFAGHWATLWLLQMLLIGLLPAHIASVALAALLGIWAWYKRWNVVWETRS